MCPYILKTVFHRNIDMRSVVLHRPGRLMMSTFCGATGAIAADRISAALERAKEAIVEERNVPLSGEIKTHKEGMELSYTAPRGNVLLGSGHIYLRTSTASLMRRLLNSIFHICDNGLQEREGEPSFSTGYAMGMMGGISRITMGSSSLRTALLSHIDREYHEKIRDIVKALFSVELHLREIVLAFPCDSLLAHEGRPGAYAINGGVPLGRLTLLNDSGQLAEFCRAEAYAEMLRAEEEASAKKIYAELMGMMGGMADASGIGGARVELA